MTGATVVIRAALDTPRQLDGDSIGLGRELTMECLPGSVCSSASPADAADAAAVSMRRSRPVCTGSGSTKSSAPGCASWSVGTLYPQRRPTDAPHEASPTISTTGLAITALMLGWALPGPRTATQAADQGKAVPATATSRLRGRHLQNQHSELQKAYGALPLAFVPNRQQTDPRVRYYAVGHRYAFFATRDELMLSLSKGKPARHLALALRFLDRSPTDEGHGRQEVARLGQLPRRSEPRPTTGPGSPATARSSTATSGRRSTCACTSGRGS